MPAFALGMLGRRRSCILASGTAVSPKALPLAAVMPIGETFVVDTECVVCFDAAET